jgi:hypothetical protein
VITTRSPFSDPEFLRSVNVVPFDTALDAEAIRNDEKLATLKFAQAREREEAIKAARGIWFGLCFSFFCFLVAYLVWRA